MSASDEEIWNPTYSPDGDFIYYGVGGGAKGWLFRKPAVGGTPRRLINIEDWPTRDIAYNYAGEDYLVGTGRWIYLGDDPQSIRWPQPDSMTGNGTLIKLFRVDEKGDTTDTGVTRRHGGAIAFSPDGKWIAYANSGSINSP